MQNASSPTVDEVTDGRGQYAIVYRAELQHIAQAGESPEGRLSRAAVQAVWTALATFANRDDPGAAYPSDATLAGITGMSPGNVRRCRDHLRTLGMLTWTERYAKGHQISNAYTLVGVPEQTRAIPQPGACIDPQPGARKARDDHSPNQSPRNDHSPTDASQSDAATLCEQMADAIGERGKRPRVTEAWIKDMDLLIRRDKKTPAQIGNVLNWLANGADEVSSFWRPNIRCPQKLRDKWDQIGEQYRAMKARAGDDLGITRVEVSDTIAAMHDQFQYDEAIG